MKLAPIAFFLLGMLLVIFFSFSSQLIASEVNSLWENNLGIYMPKYGHSVVIEGGLKNKFPSIYLNSSLENATLQFSMENLATDPVKTASTIVYSRNWNDPSLLQGYNRSQIVRAWSVNSNYVFDTFGYGNISLGTLGLRAIHIDDKQNVEISNLKGNYVGGSAYVCVYDNGTLYASEVGC